MGYYTQYKLTWDIQPGYKPTGMPVDGIVANYISSHPEDMYGVDPEGNPTDDCKWYEWEEKTAELSASIPGVLFKLHGDGEESGDQWEAYFLDGKSTGRLKAVITFPKFELSLLRPAQKLRS